MLDVITIGDCMLDTFLVIDHEEASLQCDLKKENCLLCLNYADKIPIRETGQSVGGNAANLAVALKKLGLKTAIVSELGDDINGQIIKNELEKSGVNIDNLKISPNLETRYSVILGFQAERTVLSYYSKRNYSLPSLPPSQWLYYTSLGKSFEKLQDQLQKYLQKNSTIKLAMNPGSHQLKKNLAKTKQILPKVNLLFVNKEEAGRLVGKKKKITEYFSALHKIGIKIAVITDGAKGSYASNGQEKYFMPIFPIKPVDKTGAGDAYASGFMAAHLKNKNLAEAMAWGTANAGHVTTKIGAEHGLLNEKSLQKILKKYPHIKAKKIS